MVREVTKQWHGLYTKMSLGLFSPHFFPPALPFFFFLSSKYYSGEWEGKKKTNKKLGKQVFYFWQGENTRGKIHTTVWTNFKKKKCKRNTKSTVFKTLNIRQQRTVRPDGKETNTVSLTVVLADSLESHKVVSRPKVKWGRIL